jgi:steroid delta-isomerase-like uncharacterized protein
MELSLASKIRAANRALIELGELEAIADFFASDYVSHLTDRDMEGGHDAIRKYLKMLRSAFTDIRVEVEILVEGETRVAWQRTLRGVHEGAFMGFPASGRNIVWRDMFTSRFHEGLFAEDWVVTDLAERLLLARKG